MEDDWDLHAVVRRCSAMTTTTSSTTAATTSTIPPIPFLEMKKEDTTTTINSNNSNSSNNSYVVPLPDPFETRKTTYEELHELFKPFLVPKTEPLLLQNTPICSSPLGGFNIQHQLHHHSSKPTPNSHSHAPSRAAKRRKNVMKKVCQIPAESLSSDVWAWRKYGQKPIKGSPYPRSYYRCSSSKGCLARKQVERNRSDPGMFIVTYTAEHNHPAPTHRNSLAGSTRQKPLSQASDTAAVPGDVNTKPTCSSSPTTSVEEELEAAEIEIEIETETDPDSALGAPRNGNTETRGSNNNNNSVSGDEDEEEFDNDRCDGENESGSSNMALNDDDFFDGLDGLMGGGGGGGGGGSDRLFSDQFLMFFDLPWTANNNNNSTAATTAAGGS